MRPKNFAVCFQQKKKSNLNWKEGQSNLTLTQTQLGCMFRSLYKKYLIQSGILRDPVG
jgi:hypothetical protein